MQIKNIVITGGTDGIGLAIVKKLIKKKYNIFIIGKNPEKGNRVLNTLNYPKLEFFQADLSEKHEIKNLINKLKSIKSIDVLINNAGAVFEKREVNENNIEKTFALNHLSYFHLGIGLLDQLEESINGRIINVASGAHKRHHLRLDDLENKINYNGWEAYCRSKLLNIFFTYSFNKELKTKVTCNCFHPGFVNSNFGNNNSSLLRFLINIIKNLFAISVEKSTITPIYLATSDEVKEVTGKYFYKLKKKMSSKQSYDDVIAKNVWENSIKYIK